MTRTLVASLLVLSWAADAAGQPITLGPGGDPPPPARLSVDADDDDENGVPDAAQDEAVPADDLLELRIVRPHGVVLDAEGPIRLVVEGVARDGPVSAPARGVVHVQGLRSSRSAEDAAVVARRGSAATRLRLTVVALSFLDHENRRMSATRQALGASHAITNDRSLGRGSGYRDTSSDRRDVRVELFDPSLTGPRAEVWIEAWPTGASTPRSQRRVVLERPREGLPFRSPFLRLVGDTIDQQAPGVGERVVRVGLRDRVIIRHPIDGPPATQSMRVGRPGDEDGLLAARRGRLRIRILRARGTPSVGGDDAGALRIGREQVEIANEIWLQCGITFGEPDAADVAVVDPPPPSLLAIGDRDGLPAAGGGEIRFRAGGQRIGPVPTRAGARPLDTALDIARALQRAGFRPEVTSNPPTEYGAGPTADVLVRNARDELVRVDADGSAELSTDRRQSVVIGAVDLVDGLQEFDNMTAMAGTLEERAMIKALDDDDPRTIDIFVVNHFSGGTRQGEAFIESDGGAIVNTLLLDRNGIRQQREAWTQSHEIGHVLLDHPFHPDNLGPDRPWLLMDADSSLGLVTGPKRLTPAECRRARTRSGVLAHPPLLERLDARAATPRAAPPYDLGYPAP